MSSIFWYSCLAIIGLGIAAFTMYKKKNLSTLIAFYLFASSTTFTGEYFALVVFEGYIYKPGIYADPFRDGLLGHVIINSTLWPATAIAIWAFSLKYRWISLVTIGYLLAEYLFEQLGIYEQYWWKYYMSFIIVFAFCLINKTWFNKLYQKCHGFSRSITMFFIAVIIIQIPNAVLLLSGRQFYRLKWVENIYQDSTLFAVIFSLCISFIFVIFICILQKWFWKFVPFIAHLLSDWILMNMNILVFQNGWNIFHLSIIHFISLTMFILINKYTLNKNADLTNIET